MYLIIGGNGFLGSYLVKNILESCNENIIATYNSVMPFCNNIRIDWVKCDITNFNDVALLRDIISSKEEPVKCIYLAGYIKPDDVEKNPQKGWEVNIAGLTQFINLCKDYLDCMYFASTDMAVGESINDYKFKETDVPHPVNRYGAQKRICEQIVTEAGFNVFRCPLMYGKSLIPNRPHFIEHIERVVKNKEYFEILSDYYESSLDYNTVAELLIKLIETYGAIDEKIIHICSDEKISKLEIAKRYCQANKLDDRYLKPLLLKDCIFFIARRCNILLDNAIIKQKLGIKEIKKGAFYYENSIS